MGRGESRPVRLPPLVQFIQSRLKKKLAQREKEVESATALAAYHSNPQFHGAEAGATHAACRFCGQGCHRLAPISAGPSEEGTEGEREAGLGSVTRSGGGRRRKRAS